MLTLTMLHFLLSMLTAASLCLRLCGHEKCTIGGKYIRVSPEARAGKLVDRCFNALIFR
jgi:hypothetical protein